jgi:AcrR family transcriptional regulator
MAPRKKEDFIEMQEISRKKILMSAFELFANHGYVTTTVEKIAIKAKVSKGLIYHYFNSKEDILKGLFGLLREESKGLLILRKELPAKAFLKQLIDFSIRYITQQTKINRLIIALTLQPDVISGLKDDLETMREEWMEPLFIIFKELNFDNPEAEAYLFGAMMDGLSIGYITMGEGYPLKKLKKLIEMRYGV